MKYSKIDIAYEILEKRHAAIPFYELWNKVCSIVELDSAKAEELISHFYTDLSIDGRFITLGENVWDLRKNHPFDKVHIDMNDIYSDEGSESEDDEYVDDEENEYYSEFTEKSDFDDNE